MLVGHAVQAGRKRAAIPPKVRRNQPRNSARGMRAKNGSPKESVQEFEMTAFRGWTISVGLLLVATAANAQGAPPQGAERSGYLAASDFGAPYADAPPPPRVIYGSPDYGPRGPDYGQRGYGAPEYGSGYPSYYGGPPLLPPTEIYAVLRHNGFSPLGAPRLRGLFYSISAIDRRGDDGRLLIDARNGQIVRFVPADRFGGYGGYGERYYGGAPRPSYGPLEPMPELDGSRLDGSSRLHAAEPPKIASRMPQSVPTPKAAPLKRADEKPLVEKPMADRLTPAPAPMQQSAAVQAKPADTPAVAPSAPAVPVEAKPAAPVIEPTQPMPKVQGLE
jgi:hypothetical protein